MLRRLLSLFSNPSQGTSHSHTECRAPQDDLMAVPEGNAFPIVLRGGKIIIDKWLDMLLYPKFNQASLREQSRLELSLLKVQCIWHCRSGGLGKQSKSAGK